MNFKLSGTLAVAALLAARSILAADATQIRIDGSSTVFPITEAVAEEFGKTKPGVRVTVGISGTGGGFKRFIAGETDISDASRPIKPKEMADALAGGIAFVELPIAYDGLSVVVNHGNTWVDQMTVAELKTMWAPGTKAKKWSDIRAGWPDREFHLYGPGTDSGTFDYFTEAIVGTARSSRSDYTASEDDNVLVQGVAGDKDALGYFGYAYYAENTDKLKIVPIDAGKGPVAPSPATVKSGEYAPLSRPLFLYVRKTNRPEVKEFVKFYLSKAAELVPDVGYVPLTPELYAAAVKRFDAMRIGSEYAEPKTASLEDRYLH
jgi:phosphate transport system substrate-binding protein